MPAAVDPVAREDIALDEALNAELLEHVAAQLDQPVDLAHLALTSRTCARAARAEHVWQTALARAGGPTAAPSHARRDLRLLTTFERLSWSFRPPTSARGPIARRHHVAFACNGGATLVVFGGQRESKLAPAGGGTGSEAFLADCWALDIASGTWYPVGPPAGDSPSEPGGDEDGPGPRIYTADDGGGAVLRDADGHEVLVLYGGLRASGARDNRTCALGPLGPAACAHTWRWSELQPSAVAQSDERPTPRFHHQLTAVGRSALVVSGGHDYMLHPLLDVHVLSLRGVHACAADPAADGTGSGAAGRTLDDRAMQRVRWTPAAELGVAFSAAAARAPPPSRAYHVAVAWGRHLVLFGGQRDRELLSDTWLLDTALGGWRLRELHMPEPCADGLARAAGGVVRDRLIVCGGVRSGAASGYLPSSDTWLLDLSAPGARWERVAAHPSVPRASVAQLSASVGTLHAGHTVLLLGGHRGRCLDRFGDASAGFLAPVDACAFRLAERDAGPACVRAHRCDAICVARPAGSADAAHAREGEPAGAAPADAQPALEATAAFDALRNENHPPSLTLCEATGTVVACCPFFGRLAVATLSFGLSSEHT